MATTIKLKKAIEWDKRAIAEVALALNDLTGADLLKCAREATVGDNSLLLALPFEPEFHAQVAARAAGLPVEAIKALKAPDFITVTGAVKLFLLDMDSKPKQAAESEK